jgi:ATP-dependent DNA helicase RecQ
MTSPYSEQVLSTVEALIAPGGRAHVSPFVELAQIAVLFPDAKRKSDIRNAEFVIRENSDKIASLAVVWEKFCDEKAFADPLWYQRSEFLEFYLAYYFPVNVTKLQLNLLQYLRREQWLPSDLRLVEVGVRTGTTIAAIADFLLAWDVAAKVHGLDIPIRSFRYVGIDRSEQARNLSQKVAQALAGLMATNKQATESAGREVIQGLQEAQWVHGDATAESLSPRIADGNLMVLSYVLNELGSDPERLALAEQVLNIRDGGILLALEPGGERTATGLMRLREELITGHPHAFRSTGPCGSVSSVVGLERRCSGCWNARQQSFAESYFYRAVRKAFHSKKADRRSFDEFENSLLSWSYFWVTRGDTKADAVPACLPDLAPANSGKWPASETLHYRRRLASQGDARSFAATDTRRHCAQPAATTGREVRVDSKLVNRATNAAATQASDKAAIKEAMQAKDYRRAEEIARRALGSSLTTTDAVPEALKFLPETGPDGPSPAAETLLFCWLSAEGRPTEVRICRPPGFNVPKLVHGDRVQVSGADYERSSEHGLSLVLTETTKLVPELPHHPTQPLADPSDEVLDGLACRFFGFPALRPFQRRVIRRVLSGRSILAIAATGSGKSECFILPAMLSSGVTIVVSPLVSLMTDQYEQRLRRRYGLDYVATVFNGSLPLHERQARLRRLELGYYKLAYFTPEQLERDHILDSLRRTHNTVGITYLAADEAHCIAQWGHDFRPAYLNLHKRLRSVGINAIRIALTATASPNVRTDICEELGLNPSRIEDGGDVYLESSNRPELNLIVRVLRDTGAKADDMVRRLSDLQRENRRNSRPGAAIVFVPLTGGDPNNIDYGELLEQPNGGRYSAGVVKFASYLERQLGARLSIYHSKMDLDDSQQPEAPQEAAQRPLGDLGGRTRREEQRAFIEGDTDIMVATKGFGMGIDKDNIRVVLHRSPPGNLEAYAQEAGRAGRDGEMADVVLYYSPDKPSEDDARNARREWSDHEIQSFFLDNKYIRRSDVELIGSWLRRAKPSACGSFYLTSTELIAFADSAQRDPAGCGMTQPFSWPEFGEYRNPLRAFGEHLRVLERGYWFDSIGSYVDRVLQALYRIRPEIGGARRAFLTKVAECGVEIEWPGNARRRVRAEYALASNYYFGEMLREAGVSCRELVDLISECRTTEGLAARLQLSLRDTFSLLQDLKAAEPRAPLVNFKGITVPRSTADLAEWRDRYGAFKRVKPAAGNGNPTIDDWFPWKAMTRPRGWEIQTGDGYRNIPFDQFLERFVSLHDERERNDRSSYQRLLTDYVGVSETGEVLDYGLGRRQCLRSVLLGYLGTSEVVVDGNCRSCSNCVPDETKLRAFSLADRRQVVVRMAGELAALFDRLKRQAKTLVAERDSEQLFEAIRTEEEAGRSLRGYFAGWSARLLDENAEHVTGAWLRLDGMRRQVLPLDFSQLVDHAAMLIDLLGGGDRRRVADVMLAVKPDVEDEPALVRRYAEVLGKLGHFAEAMRTLSTIVDNERLNEGVRLEIASEIRNWHRSGGPLEDHHGYAQWTLRVASLEPDLDKATDLFQSVAARWSWEEVERIAGLVSVKAKQIALLYAWGACGKDHAGKVIQELSSPERIEELWVLGRRAREIYDVMAPTALAASARASRHYVAVAPDSQRALILAMVGLSFGATSRDRYYLEVCDAVGNAFHSWSEVSQWMRDLGMACDEAVVAGRLLEGLCAVSKDGVLPSEAAALVLRDRSDFDTTLNVLSALAKLRDDALHACEPVVLDLVNRAADVPRDRWPGFLGILGGAGGVASTSARRLIVLLAEVLKQGGPDVQALAAGIKSLASTLPTGQTAALNKIVDLADRYVGESAECLREVAALQVREGKLAAELDVWLRLAAHGGGLVEPEATRALQLLASDGRWGSVAEKIVAARVVIGPRLSGAKLADCLLELVKDSSHCELSDWAETVIDAPDVWVAGWIAWLRAHPASTHFQAWLKGDRRLGEVLSRCQVSSKAAIFEYLPVEVIAADAELRRLAVDSLASSPRSVMAVALWLQCEEPASEAEAAGIRAFVESGPSAPMAGDVADAAWMLFDRYADSAFLAANAGMERWLRTLASPNVAVTEYRLLRLADTAGKAKLDGNLAAIVSELRRVCATSSIADEQRLSIQRRIPDVSVCARCRGTGKETAVCMACGGKGKISVKSTGQNICRRCGGSGGSGGGCPACFGSGQTEIRVLVKTRCHYCVGTGEHTARCSTCEGAGVVRRLASSFKPDS